MLESTRAVAVAALERERYELEHEYQRYADWLSIEPQSEWLPKEIERVTGLRDAIDAALADLTAEAPQAQGGRGAGRVCATAISPPSPWCGWRP